MHGTMNVKEMASSPNLEKDPFCSRNCILLLQVSCIWQGQYLLTVSLSGFINYLDVNNPDKHIRIIKVIIMACSAVIAHVANFTGTVVTSPRASPGSL
jgi:hypothetical protein